ncbi:MAG: hypothetical protein LBR10_06095 [Prevotellaceae bacterium]|nr:hypothetical protein [Prevotellaceae bacterium]
MSVAVKMQRNGVYFGCCIRRELSASGARVANIDSHNVVEAVDACVVHAG